MIEREFLDRVPTYPGRVKLTHVGGDEYDMERADGPVVAGTPLDKATFDSVVHSRLTGRYYVPAVTRTQSGIQSDLTADPIPTSGWNNLSGSTSENGGYKATVNAGYGNYPSFALDGNDQTNWTSPNSTEQWFQIEFPQAIKVKTIRIKLQVENSGYPPTITVQGSANGTSWSALRTFTGVQQNYVSVYDLTTTGDYKYYRFVFSYTGANSSFLYTVGVAKYDIITYTNAFTISSGVPDVWTTGQRILVEMPNTVVSAATTGNTLNGIPVQTILQPGRRYELRYTGSAFVAKEV